MPYLDLREAELLDARLDEASQVGETQRLQGHLGWGTMLNVIAMIV